VDCLPCRTCGATIVLARTPSGGWLPLDADPHPLGSVVVDHDGYVGPQSGMGAPDYSRRYHRHTCQGGADDS